MDRNRLIQLQNIIARTAATDPQMALATSPELAKAGGEKTVGSGQPWMPVAGGPSGINAFGAMLLFVGVSEEAACDFAPFGDGWAEQESRWPSDVRAMYRMRELAEPRAMCEALSAMIESA